MAETDAIFGGEHSGHFYFRDFWRADSGMLAALHALAALAETDRPLSAPARRLRALRRSAARSTPRSPTRRRSSPTLAAAYADRDGRRARRARRADRHATPTGGSTSAPPTPSRCCGSTPRARDRATMDRGPRRRARHDQERRDEPRPRSCSRSSSAPTATASSPRRGEELVCQACGLAYPVRDDIPVLLVDEARQPGLSRDRWPTWFDESRLDDERALARADALLRALAEAGARVRREAGEAAEATGRGGRAQPRATGPAP